MAKSKNKKTLRDDPTPIISRSYDPYSMEKRIYNLEQGGGVGPTPPTPSVNITHYVVNATSNQYGWWHVTDENGNELDITKHVILALTYERTNEAEGENAYLSCEWMIDQFGSYMMRWVSMLTQSKPYETAQTHKVHVTYYTLPET